MDRDGQRHHMAFVRGKTVKKLTVLGKAKGTGTTVRFKPDPEIFTVLEYHYTTLADRLRQLAFLNKGVTITHQGRAGGAGEGGDLLRQGRPGPVRRVAQPEQEGAAPQADLVQRDQGRRRGGPRPAVRGRVQREHLHLREQHQHPRRRHPPHRVQVGAHPDHQRRRQAARLPEEGRSSPSRARTSARGSPASCTSRCGSRSSRGRPRPSWATPRSRGSSRRW